MRDLAEGGYIDRAEPVLFIGECGNWQTHLLTGLCVAALPPETSGPFHYRGRTGERAVEAKHQLQLRPGSGALEPL